MRLLAFWSASARRRFSAHPVPPLNSIFTIVRFSLIFSRFAFRLEGASVVALRRGVSDALTHSRRAFLPRCVVAARAAVGRGFGTCQTLECGEQGPWFRWFVQYLRENQLSWSYWPLNGTQSSGEKRKYDEVETYGLLTPDYQRIAAPEIVRLLQTIEGSPQPHKR